MRVNVVAPMALTQAFLPGLRAGNGRIMHLGTSVAFRPQEGTLTYGVTKMAFHRLYQQINAEPIGVPCGSLSPGMVDTEGKFEFNPIPAGLWNDVNCRGGAIMAPD